MRDVFQEEEEEEEEEEEKEEDEKGKDEKESQKEAEIGERERERWKGFSSLVEGTLLVDAFIVLDNRIKLSCRSW